MAVIKEVASFDVDTKQAVASINNYIKKLNELEKQRKENLRLGKSVSAVNKEIAATQKAIANAVNQETQTRQGLNAQLRATAQARRQLSTETQKQIGLIDKQTKSTRNALRQNRRAFADLRFVAVGAVAGVVAGLGQLEEGIRSVENVLFPQLALQRQIAEASKGATVEFIKEAAALENKFDKITNANKGTKEYDQAIADVTEQYGDYLSEIAREQLLLGNVTLAREEARKALLKDIIAKQKAALAEKLLGDIVEARITQIQRQAEAQQGATGAANKFVGFVNTLGKNALNFSIGRWDKLGQSASNATDILNGFTDIGLKSSIEQLKILANTNDEATASLIAQNPELKGIIDLFKGFDTETKKTADSTGNANKEAKDLTGTLAGLQQQLSDAQKFLREGIQITDEEALAKQQTEIVRLQEEIKKLEEFIKNVGAEGENLKEIDLFEPNFNLLDPALDQSQVEEELQKGLDKLSIEDLKTQIGRLDIQGFIDATAIETARKEALRVFKGTSEERDELNEQFNQRIRQRERETTRQRIQLQLRILAIQKKLAEESKKDTTDIEKQIAQLQLELAKLDGEQVTVDITANTDDLDEAQAKARETALTIIDGLGQLSEQVTSFFAEQASQAVARLDEQVARQKSVLDELLSNQSTANAQQVQLERERLDRLNRQREQAAQRERAVAVAQIALNAALTIARAAAEGGGIGSAITIAAALLALTFGFVSARQTAQNATQGFAEGTLAVKRKGHPSGTDTIPAWLTENEAVIPVQENKDYHPVVEAIYNRRIPPSELNAFVRGYKSSAKGISKDLVPKSVLKQLDQNGITLSMLNVGGGNARQMDQMIKELRSVKETLANLPVQRLNITERGLTKTVSKGIDKETYLGKRFAP